MEASSAAIPHAMDKVASPCTVSQLSTLNAVASTAPIIECDNLLLSIKSLTPHAHRPIQRARLRLAVALVGGGSQADLKRDRSGEIRAESICLGVSCSADRGGVRV